MIRIDLGRDNLTGRSGKGVGKKLGKRFHKFEFNLGFFSLMGLALILAFLPQPFLKRYRVQAVKKHQGVVKRLNQQIQAYDREINLLKPYQNELASYQKQKQTVSERLNVVQNLLAIRKTPVTVLDTVGQSLPKKTWLSAIMADFQSQLLTVKGSSLLNDEISDYIDKLSESVYLSSVKLVDMRTVKKEEIDIRMFEIRAVPNPNVEVSQIRDLSSP